MANPLTQVVRSPELPILDKIETVADFIHNSKLCLQDDELTLSQREAIKKTIRNAQQQLHRLKEKQECLA